MGDPMTPTMRDRCHGIGLILRDAPAEAPKNFVHFLHVGVHIPWPHPYIYPLGALPRSAVVKDLWISL